jgi:hypothetical protein
MAVGIVAVGGAAFLEAVHIPAMIPSSVNGEKPGIFAGLAVVIFLSLMSRETGK